MKNNLNRFALPFQYFNNVLNASGSTLNLTSATFSGNTANDSLVRIFGASTTDGYGTADVVTTSKLNMSNVNFADNNVGYGIYVGEGAVADISDTTITGNTSTKQFINLIGSNTSTLTDASTVTNYSSATIDNLYVSDNTSLYRLVNVEQGADLTFKNSKISNNTFTSAFAYILGSSEEIVSTATFSDITYENNAGTGINLASHSDVLIENSKFLNNGDALLKYGPVVNATAGTLTMNNVLVEGNSSLNGAVNTSKTNVTINNSDFIGNTGTWGGAIRVQNATITDTLFKDNVNVGGGLSGGALYFAATASGQADNVVNFNVVNRDMKYSGNKAGASGFAYIITQNAEQATAAGDDAVSATINFDIAKDRTLEIGNFNIAGDEIRSGTNGNHMNQAMTKNGEGSFIVNSYMKDFYGTLDVNAGSMYINKKIGSETITVAENATLAIRVGQNSDNNNKTFANATSTTIQNNGKLIITAQAGIDKWSKGLVLGEATLTFAGNDAIIYGGSINYDAYTYTASTATTVSVLGSLDSSGTIAQNGIIRYNNADGNVALDMQFNSANEFTMNMLEGIDVSSNASIEEAYLLTSTGLTASDSALISFLVDDSTLSVTDLQIYRMEDSEWLVAEDLDYLQYDGQYLSFITNDLNSAFGWGYSTTVPEPSTYAAIAGALALGFAMYRRRK